MTTLAVVVGCTLVAGVLIDMIGTLVSTRSLRGRWWLSKVLYRSTWWAVRSLALALPDGRARHTLLATYAPLTVPALLVVWVVHQIVGFGLIWWGLGDVDGAASLVDHIYYSGVVFFTVGFGEVVPAGTVPRFGALVEAFTGVLTTALVIGYLPALYTAYSERERKLMTLDDGSEGRIVPTNLVLAWSPNAEVDELLGHFEGWTDWMSAVLESHSTFPMLRYFRSQQYRQNWVTAVGLVADAALHCQMIRGADNRAPYWALREATVLLRDLAGDADLSAYRAQFDETYDAGELSAELHRLLTEHGFDVYPLEESMERVASFRRGYDAHLEHLIDELVAPRGFWAREVGHPAPWARIQPLEDRPET